MKPWRAISEQRRAGSAAAPFRQGEVVQIVLPSIFEHLTDSEASTLRGLKALLQENAEGLQLELGAPFVFTERDPGHGPRMYVGPTACNPALGRLGMAQPTCPVLHVLRQSGIVIVDAPTVGELFESFSLLKSMHWEQSTTLISGDCESVEEAVLRIVREVACTWPSFARTQIDWNALCERYADRVLEASDPVAVMQRWLAELGDAHLSANGTVGRRLCERGRP